MNRKHLEMAVTFVVAVGLVAGGQVVCADASQLLAEHNADADTAAKEDATGTARAQERSDPWDSLQDTRTYGSKSSQRLKRHKDDDSAKKWAALKHTYNEDEVGDVGVHERHQRQK